MYAEECHCGAHEHNPVALVRVYPLPGVGCSAKMPLWTADEWKAVRTALLKPILLVDLELTDDKVVVLLVTGTKATNEDDDDTGTKILIALVNQGRTMPATFAARPYAPVCSIPCRLCLQ